MRGRTVLAVALAASVVAGTSGCASLMMFGQNMGTQSYACASWVAFDTEEAMAAEAVLIIEGTVGPETGTFRFDTGPGVEHTVTVDSVIKGDLTAGEITVAALRDHCSGEDLDPKEDPLVEGESVRLYLRPATGAVVKDDPNGADEIRVWSTLTPWAGIVPLD